MSKLTQGNERNGQFGAASGRLQFGVVRPSDSWVPPTAAGGSCFLAELSFPTFPYRRSSCVCAREQTVVWFPSRKCSLCLLTGLGFRTAHRAYAARLPRTVRGLARRGRASRCCLKSPGNKLCQVNLKNLRRLSVSVHSTKYSYRYNVCMHFSSLF